MAAHVGTTTTAPPILGHPIRIRRPRPRPRPHILLAIVLLLLLVALVAAAPRQAAAFAHEACTLGNPDHLTCGEALWLLGYP